MRLHGLRSVQYKIQDDLLNLRRVALDHGQTFLQVQNNFGADQLEFVIG